MSDLRQAAQQALEALEFFKDTAICSADTEAASEAINALRAALAEPVQEPWGTRERFYEAIDRAVENVKQEMRIKTVTMRLPEYDVAMPIIDAYSGHVLVGPVPTPPQRKPLTEEEILSMLRLAPPEPSLWPHLKDEAVVGDVQKAVLAIARAIERAHGIGGSDD